MPHIRVIGPSSHIPDDGIDTAIQWLEKKGATVSVASQIYAQDRQSAGTNQEKLDALHGAFADPTVDAIITSCGGNRAIHLLPHIDFALIRDNPKPLFGFSDITILLNAIYAKTGIPTFHGPTMTQIQKPLPNNQLEQFWEQLTGVFTPIEWNNVTVKNNGTAQGVLLGGNLSVFQAMIGTPYLPTQTDQPYILFFEDVGDELSRYDRILAHMRQSGWLNNASALLFGDFHSTDNSARVPFGRTIDEIINENTNGLNIPIVTNCPFGHRGNLWTLPVGKPIAIEASNTNVILSFFN
jgi:muramoyltetrapeptide carboxypeptidase